MISRVDVRQIYGNWDLGFSLDKHMLHSEFIGDDQWGHPMFDSTRTDTGEAIYQLKYQQDFSKCSEIARSIQEHILPRFQQPISFIIAMPPSKQRARQPVPEIALALAQITGIPCYNNVLIKTKQTPQMKDLDGREEKIAQLVEAFSINTAQQLPYHRNNNVLIIDDLYDTGTSLEAATQTLRSYGKINHIFVATATRKRND